MPATPSQNVLIAKRYCASKKDLKTATDLTEILVRVGEPSTGEKNLNQTSLR